MNKEAIDLLILQNPGLESSREQLEAMQPGTYCIHRSWGLGKIRSYDERNNRLIIDFEDDKEGHPMDPAFCVGRLELLPPSNVLARHRTDPEAIEKLIKEQPTDLIVELLANTETRASTASEIERQLAHVLGEARFKKWWATTKKLLIKDPRVAVPSKKSEPYIYREVPITAEDEILEEFFRTKAPKNKITLAASLISLSLNHEDIKEALPDVLKTLTSVIEETRLLNGGDRLFGLWVRNDLARFIHEDVDSLEPTSSSMIHGAGDLSSLAVDIPATHYKRLLDLVCRCFPEDWKRVLFDLLKNSSGRFTNECVSFLIERDCEEDLIATLRRWLDEQTLKGPLLLWIVKNRNGRRYSKMLQELITPRFLSVIFYAVDTEALLTDGSRRITLADTLSDDPDLIPELLAEATPETAYDLATTLMLNQGFEDLTKRSLLARFIRQFPNVQSLVDSEARQRDDRLIVSQKSYDERYAEYQDLVKNKIPENKRAIAVARAHGDLRENAEYKMARQEQDTLLAHKSHLDRDFSRVDITDFSEAPIEHIGIGSVVKLKEGSTGNIVTYAILGAWDGRPEENIVSYETPLGRSLISHQVGEQIHIEVDGAEEEWEIQSISRYVD